MMSIDMALMGMFSIGAFIGFAIGFPCVTNVNKKTAMNLTKVVAIL